MLDSWTTAGRAQPNVLANAGSAEKFWSTLREEHPFEMQRRLCDELATGVGAQRPDIDRFRALRQLDRRADRLLEGFLAEYAALCGQSTTLERKLWHAALELSRTFASEFERFMRIVSQPGASAAWQERTPELAIRLFRHREVELVLALSRYERWPRGRWKSLHDAYRFVLSMDAATRPVRVGRRSDASVVTATPEQAFIRVLLLQMMDGGRFRPEEIAWVRRQIRHWSPTLGMQRPQAITDQAGSRRGFVVDLAGFEGLVRPSATGTGDLLWLDPAPIGQAIDAMLAEHGNAENVVPTSRRARLQQSLLFKLRNLYAPQRVLVSRRGERTAIALTSVEATLGDLQAVFRMLRDEAKQAAAASNIPVPYAEEITITDVGATPAPLAPSSAGAASRRTSGARPTLSATWQVRDRSESGTRLRGKVADSAWMTPGLLITFRSDRTVPWTLAVVRRSTRLMGINVELGVEHLGRDPQRVILLSSAPAAQQTDARPARIPALYLPESETFPKIPIRTLVVPMCEFAPDRVMTMLSKMSQVQIRLKEPLEWQADFVWTSFEVVETSAVTNGQPHGHGKDRSA